MDEFNRYTHIAAKIARLLSGVASDREREEVDEWRSLSQENEELYGELTGGAFWEEGRRHREKVNIAGAYLKFLEKRKRSHRNRMIRRAGAIAASLLLPLAVWVAVEPERQEMIPLAGQKEVALVDSILPGEIKAELQLADGSTVRLGADPRHLLPEQSGTSVVAGDNGLSYEDKQPINELVYNTLKIPRGGEYSLTLGDGTVVFLNSETELRYPVQFVGKERRVFLSGEAFFQVARDEAKPFIVETVRSKVEVLGTSFNLRSYIDEEDVAATLVEGKVRLVAEDDRNINLRPGEQGVVDELGHLTKKEVDTYLYTAWKDGNFVFRKQPLEEVMRVVARWYDVNVHFVDASQRKISFSGNVKRYDDFGKIVEMLEMTGNTRFEINGKNIFIREK